MENLLNKPMSRKEAKSLGLKFYLSKPCPKGHNGLRYTSTYSCVECTKADGFLSSSKKRQAEFRASPHGKYLRHKGHAKERGIEFKLTFEEWMKIWEDSGHFHLRGNTPGCYVMGRFGDSGPYEVGNVSIIPFYDNFQDPNKSGGTHKRKKEKCVAVRDCDEDGNPLI